MHSEPSRTFPKRMLAKKNCILKIEEEKADQQNIEKKNSWKENKKQGWEEGFFEYEYLHINES